MGLMGQMGKPRHGNDTCRRCGYKVETVNGAWCALIRERVEYADVKPNCYMEN